MLFFGFAFSDTPPEDELLLRKNMLCLTVEAGFGLCETCHPMLSRTGGNEDKVWGVGLTSYNL